MDPFLTPSYIFVFGTHVRSEITVIDRASISCVYVLTVRQGWPQHRVATWCFRLGGSLALGQKRGSLIASPSPCHTWSSGARCRGVSPSSSRCRPSRSYLHAPTPPVRDRHRTTGHVSPLSRVTAGERRDPLLRATRKDTFSDGTAPATSPSLRRHVAKSADPPSHHATQLHHMTAPPGRPMGARGARAPSRLRDRAAATGESARNVKFITRHNVDVKLCLVRIYRSKTCFIYFPLHKLF